MARGGGGQAGLFDLREDIQRREDDERRFDDREEDFRRDQAFERALEQEMRQFEQDRAVEEILKAIINDPNMIMDDNGVIARIDAPRTTSATRRVPARRPSGREVIRRSRQFSRANILPPLPKPRKKNKKHCKNLSECFKKANSSLRLKNGKLRKGKTQSDVAKMAHRLLKKL